MKSILDHRYLWIFSLLILLTTVILVLLSTQNGPATFDADRAYQDVVYQVGLGARTPGSEAHKQVIEWMQTELVSAGWEVNIQQTIQMDHPIKNVIAKRDRNGPWIILCAHYDSRFFADRDPNPENQGLPVPGANDGASGVAVLLELARVIPPDTNLNIWLVFFDAEDQGNIPGWDWILGSTAFVQSLESRPVAVVLLDMVGDRDLRFPMEQNSTPALTMEIWKVAEEAGYGKIFVTQPGLSILDDHIPFLNAGIPAVDIIDFDYAYYHTIEDTPDKVSPQSLQAVGETILAWLNYRDSMGR